MAIFLDRIDSSPIANIDLETQFLLWIGVLVDTLNENMSDIQIAFNLLTAPSYTQTEITNMESDGQLGNGVILYDSTNDEYVGRQAGSLVKFTTAAWP